MDTPTRAPPLINPRALMVYGTAWLVAYRVPRLSLTNPAFSMVRRLPGAQRSLHRLVCAMADTPRS